MFTLLTVSALALAGTASAQAATSLADIEHVVFFMQENRAFDHYFGSLFGVRGFADPNAPINADGKSVFYQKVNGSLSNATDFLLPWYINYQGGEYLNGTQCMDGGSNGFENNHAAYNNGSNDMWALTNDPTSIAYFKRQDIPIHYAIADSWTIGDMYQEGQMASTWPNRVHWMTGTVNIPGGPTNSTKGPVLDNNDTPGCSHLSFSNFLTGQSYHTTANVSCFPYDWKTVPEYLEELGISWFVNQADDNFGCNELAAFKTFIDGAASPLNDTDNPLVVKAMSYAWSNNDWEGGYAKFKQDVATGNLPEVTWIIPTTELSEHPPYTPRQGAWSQADIIDALQNSPIYNKTILFISYDETGGWADHVPPFHAPAGTPGEWVVDPLTNISTFSGPGFRLPFYAISPYSRGGNVFTEPSDHTSQILFLEKWAAARGHPFTTQAISAWRREHMSDLTGMFDFSGETFDASPVKFPAGEEPVIDGLTGLLAGAELCQAKYEGSVNAKIPYGLQTPEEALAVEAGFRPVRGGLTEGRYLVLESAGVALSAGSSLGVASPLAQKETDAAQRFVLHAPNPMDVDATIFSLSNGDSYINAQLGLDSAANAAIWNITYIASSTSYNIKDTKSGMYLTLTSSKPVLGNDPAPFKIYSVTF